MTALSLFSALLLLVQGSSADTIECDNGDRYNGKVISMDEKKVTLQNDLTGTLTIPRERIVTISFREKPAAPPAVKATSPALSTNIFNPQSGSVPFDAAAIQKVQNELLRTATPEATQMFNEMVQGLMGGQMNIGDIRGKAQTTLQELRDLQKDFGDDETAEILNTYGAILENFLRQSARPTNSVPLPKAPTPRQAP
jgi:hypothetical protein